MILAHLMAYISSQFDAATGLGKCLSTLLYQVQEGGERDVVTGAAWNRDSQLGVVVIGPAALRIKGG